MMRVSTIETGAGVLIAVAAILGAVWAIEQHFITRREFEVVAENVRELRRDMKQLRRQLGVAAEE